MTAAQVEALPENDAQKVLEAWVKAGRTELAVSLRESSSKAHARLAKKALYQLQSSGVAVEAQPVKREDAPIEPPVNQLLGVLSSQIGSGERAFFFAVPIRGGQGIEIFQGIVHDQFGLLQIGSERTNRNLYRARLRQLEADPRSGVMLVPFPRVKLELGRAMTLNARTKTEYQTDVGHTLERLGITPQDPDVAIPPLEPTDAASRADGATLHLLPEIAEWAPSEADLVVLSSQVGALDVLPIDGAAKEAKKETLARTFAQQLFTPELRLLWARRLWYTGELLENRGRNDDAARARAEARRLAHETEASPFAEELFVKVLPQLKMPSAAELLGKR